MHRAHDKAAPRRAEHLDKDAARAGVECAVAVGAQGVAHRGERGLIEREIAFGAVAVQQQLMAALQLGRERDRTVLMPGGQDRVEKAASHSTRSTKTSILPPQARPTSQACSFVTPKSRRRGMPSRIVSKASVTTAPSTQPPETEPTKAPSLSTASLEPSRRAEEPQVLTTVASATPLPDSRQRAACSRISAVSLICCPSTFLSETVALLGHRGGALPLRGGADHIHQRFQAFQIVHRPKLVDMGQHRLHAQ